MELRDLIIFGSCFLVGITVIVIVVYIVWDWLNDLLMAARLDEEE